MKGEEKYSWCKAPRYDGEPHEVGPLARMIVGYAAGDKQIKPLVEGTLKATGLPATVLFSTLGRTAARGIETKLIAGWAKEFYGQLLSNIKNGDNHGYAAGV